MNKYFLSSLILAGALTIGSLNAQTFSGGTGTQVDPYLISNIDDINELRDLVESLTNSLDSNWSRGKYFELTQDIADTVTIPIGITFFTNVPNRAFEGHMNGKGFAVTLNINGGQTNRYGGLFSIVSWGSIIDLKTKGYVTGFEVSGGIVGIISAREIQQRPFVIIKGCISEVDLTTHHLTGTLGGIVSQSAKVIITDCVFNGSISVVFTKNTSNFMIGGIVASAGTETIIDGCLNLGNLFFDVPNGFVPSVVGGIAGNVGGIGSKIISSKNAGFVKSIKTQNHNVGGITGTVGANSLISDNINVNVVEGHPDSTGCIVGKKPPPTVITTIINNHYDKQMCGEDD